jgi:hypothetical protein
VYLLEKYEKRIYSGTVATVKSDDHDEDEEEKVESE